MKWEIEIEMNIRCWDALCDGGRGFRRSVSFAKYAWWKGKKAKGGNFVASEHI